MPTARRRPPSDALALGYAIRDMRSTIGWSQTDLARRAGATQGWVSKVERGKAQGLSLTTVHELVTALGGRFEWRIEAPFLADRRLQRDAGHARCVAHVVARLRRAGWEVASEVEVGGDRSRGWIDVLAHHPGSRVMLVIEVKTELHDLGAIERTLGWYEREAWTVARRLSWRPTVAASALLLLATAAVDERVAANRAHLRLTFPGRAPELGTIVAGDPPVGRSRHVAMIDPLSRRAAWLRPLRLDGRRTTAPYGDYAAFLRACEQPSKSHRRC